MPPLPTRALFVLSHGINVAFSYGDSLKKLKYHLSVRPQQEFTDACRQEGDSEQGSFAFNAFWFVVISQRFQ